MSSTPQPARRRFDARRLVGFRRPAALRRLVIIASALAVLAVGCSATSSPMTSAAVVDGTSISDEGVNALAGLDANEGTVPADEFRDALSLLIIQQALLHAAVTDFGLEDLSSQVAVDAFVASLPPEQQQNIQVSIDAGVADGRDRAATEHYLYTQQSLAKEVSDAIMGDPAFLESVYNDNPELLVTVCAGHILVATEDEAVDVMARLEAGEDFGAIATEVSLDQQSPGGVLPCPVSVYSFGQELAPAMLGAPVGEVTGPVLSQFGLHVLLIESRDQPESFEEFAADPSRWVPATVLDTELTTWYNNVLSEADITVRSPIGTWNPEAYAITPPPPSP